MNRYKTVMMPIEVPDCDYCLEPTDPRRICPHFDNEGGHPTCGMNIASLKRDDSGGQRKPAECLELMPNASREA